MWIDDDPKTPAPAPEGAPADDREPEATEEPEGEQPEGEADTAEQKAPTDEEDVGEDDEQDDEQDDEGDDEDDGDKPKRKSSRAERYKRRAEELAARLDAERSRHGSLPQDQAALQRAFQQRVYEEIGDPPDPNDPKYKDNYVRFERETQAWINDERQVSREVRKEFIANIRREQERVGGLVVEHKERIARLRSKVKDFDAVLAKATVPVAPHVERLILESKRSDRLTYHLARDQAKLARLNNMSSESAAREIGRIEGRLALPQPKAQTKARPPIKPLRGGGTSPPSGLAAVNAYMKKRYGDRA